MFHNGQEQPREGDQKEAPEAQTRSQEDSVGLQEEEGEGGEEACQAEEWDHHHFQIKVRIMFINWGYVNYLLKLQ